jgi:flagellar biosynthesis chaperone FliJ
MFLPSTVYPDDLNIKDQSNVYMNIETAKSIVVELEQKRILQEQVVQYDQIIKDQQVQIGIMQKMVEEQNKKLEVAKRTFEAYDGLFKYQEELHKKELETLKPSLRETVIEKTGYMGLGAMFAILLMVIL